jgi:tRNA A37 threonylcarbamoyladenosine biosynthesis protein TsaE
LLAEGDCERFSDDNIVLVEWANNASQWWPNNGLYVHLTHNSDGGRTLAVHSSGERGAELAQAYCELLKSGINIEPTAD